MEKAAAISASPSKDNMAKAHETQALKDERLKKQAPTPSIHSMMEPVKPARARLEALPGLRFLAELQIIGFHYYTTTNTHWVNNMNLWGNCPLTFFFLLSGFIFGYIYGGRDPSHRIDWWDFMAKRFAGLYPLYFFSIIMGFSMLSHRKPNPFSLFVTMALMASKALPSAFWNPVSAPAWTVGAFFILYAFLPYILRMLRATTPFTRLYILPPLLFLGSMAMPAMDLGYNTGILHVFTRAIGICSITNFVQGLNLGLLYLEHDWERHPKFLQRIGATAVVVTIAAIAIFVDEKSLPRFIVLWRDHGLFSPFYCLLIWYTARDRDILCSLLKTQTMQFLGNISYGMYLFQQVVFNFISQTSVFFRQHHYVQAYYLIPQIVVAAAFGVHVVQTNYTDRFYRWLRRKIAIYVEKDTSYIASLWELTMVLFDLPLTKALTIALFIPAYVWFVNYQGCMPLKCSIPKWSHYPWPSGMVDRFWIGDQDYNWAVNWWFIPCERVSFLPHGSKTLTTLVTFSITTSLLAIPALLTSFVLVWRSSILGKYLTSAAPGLELPAFIRRNMEIATQEEMEAHMAIRGSAVAGYQSSGGAAAAESSAAASAPAAASLGVPPDAVEETKSHEAPVAPVVEQKPVAVKRTEEGPAKIYLRLLVKTGSPTLSTEENVWRHAKFLTAAAAGMNGRARFILEVIGYRPHPKLIARLPAGTYENAPAETIKSLSAVAASANLSIKFYYDESGRDGTCGSFTNMVTLARRRSSAKPADGIMYMEANCRLDRAALDEALGYLKASADDNEIGLLNQLRVEGSDEVVPGLFTISHFNVLDRRRNHASAPTIAMLHGYTDADTPAPRVADAVEVGLCHAGGAPFANVTLGRGHAYFRTLTWTHYRDTRVKTIRAYIARQGLRAAATDLLSEFFMHVAFLTSQAVLLLSPIYQHYVEADYCKYGSGFDCSNGFGWGTRFYRSLAALLCAVYTSIYLHGFVTTFCARDGLVRMTVLFYLTLLALPVLAVLDSVITLLGIFSSSWSGEIPASIPVAFAKRATSIFTGSGNEDTEVDGEFAPLLLEAEHMELGLPPAEESDESTHSEAAIREVSI